MDPRPTTMIEELRPLLMASYPDLSADAVIDVVERDQRALVHLLHVKVTRAGGGTRSLIVKSNGPVGPSEDRPRLVSRVDPLNGSRWNSRRSGSWRRAWRRSAIPP